jgi:signal transduction histidine kinase
VVFEHSGRTLLPLTPGEESDLYVVLDGRYDRDVLDYAAILLASAAMALNNAGQYQALVHEAEKRQAVARELTDALEFKSQFVANISHEIRTPLYSFIGFGELLLGDGYGPLAPEQTEAVQRMVKNAANLLELINDILDLSKLDAGAMKVRISPACLDDFLHDIEETCVPLLKDKPVALHVRVHETPRVIATDWTIVRQVMLNLVSNAVKFTMKGRVDIEASFDTARSELCLSVRDTGVGIDPERLSEIFEPFRQLEDSYTKRFAGSGLGLAISTRQAELLRGRIAVDSKRGVGSTFSLYLPCSHPQLRDEPEEAPRADVRH